MPCVSGVFFCRSARAVDVAIADVEDAAGDEEDEEEEEEIARY
jgi:hypothetical protein